MSKIILEKEKKETFGLIKKADKIAVINHIKMDPDAFWSLWAFYILLKNIWKEVVALNDLLPPESFKFLMEWQIFETNFDLKKFDPDIIISFDASSLDQLWAYYTDYKAIFDEKDFVCFDHHPSNPKFAKINILDSNASSTCEIVYDFIKEFFPDITLWEQEIDLLMAWLVADTNNFINTNSTPKSLRMWAELIEKWAKHQKIIEKLFRDMRIQQRRLWSIAMANMVELNWWEIIYSTLEEWDFSLSWATFDETSWIIQQNFVPVKSCKLWFLLYEDWKWNVKLSTRSKDDKFNMKDFCSEMWWWWHIRAWWAILKSVSLIEAEKIVLEKIQNKFYK